MDHTTVSRTVFPCPPPTALFSSDYNAFKTRVPSGAEVFFLRRSATANPSTIPIVLIHGFPQNSALWYRFVDHLPPSLDVIVPDLPGYGLSTKDPSADGSSLSHSKRELGKDMLALVDILRGPDCKCIAYGHDRGARVAYRMALDHPHRLLGMAALDIVPGIEQFRAMNLAIGRHRETLQSYHWLFLAQPYPLPETLIAGSVDFYIASCLDRWSGPRMRGKYEPTARRAWIEPYVKSSDCIRGSCEDYRAGARIDLEHEEEPAKLTVPSLILYSHALTRHNVIDMWELHIEEGTPVRYHQTGDDQSGHFNPIEAEEDCVNFTLAWLNEQLKIHTD